MDTFLAIVWFGAGIAGGIWFGQKRPFSIWGITSFPPDLWILLGWSVSGPIGLLFAWLIPQDPKFRP
mgnify:CR=1 FL=1